MSLDKAFLGLLALSVATNIVALGGLASTQVSIHPGFSAKLEILKHILILFTYFIAVVLLK
jgi:hypothetical protein